MKQPSEELKVMTPTDSNSSMSSSTVSRIILYL